MLTPQFPGKELVCVGNSDKYISICYVDSNVQQETIKELLFKRVQILLRVIRFQQLPSILRTSNGKIDYHAMTMLISESSTLTLMISPARWRPRAGKSIGIGLVPISFFLKKINDKLIIPNSSWRFG